MLMDKAEEDVKYVDLNNENMQRAENFQSPCGVLDTTKIIWSHSESDNMDF